MSNNHAKHEVLIKQNLIKQYLRSILDISGENDIASRSFETAVSILFFIESYGKHLYPPPPALPPPPKKKKRKKKPIKEIGQMDIRD